MLATFGNILKKPFQFIGILPESGWEMNDEERELLKRLHERYRDSTPAYVERQGFVTQISNNCIELNHRWNYRLLDRDTFAIGDYVAWKEYKTDNDVVVKDVVRVNEKEQLVQQLITSKIIKVDGKKYQTSSGIIFHIEQVRCELEFHPVLGDIVKLECDCPKDKIDNSLDTDPCLLVVKRITPANSKLVTGAITSWDPSTSSGVIRGDVWFHQNACAKVCPSVGVSVDCHVVGGDYEGTYKWRAYHMVKSESLNSSKGHFFNVSRVPFFNVVLGETKIVDLCISNKSQAGMSCRIEAVKFFINNKPVHLGEQSVKLPFELPSETTISWPVEVKGDKLGRREIKIEWKIARKRQPVWTSFYFRTVQQDLGDNPSRDTPRQVCPIIPGPRMSRKPVFRRVPLKDYHIPEKLRECCLENVRDLTDTQIALQQECPALGAGLLPETYGEWMHTLLFIEEIAEEKEYEKLATQAPLYSTREYVSFSFPADSEHSIIVCGDTVLVSKPWESIKYEGKVWAVSSTQIFMRFASDFEKSIRTGALYDMEFRNNRGPSRRRHQAVDLVLQSLGPEWLFPQAEPLIENPPSKSLDVTVDWINDMLNFEQKSAVRNILTKNNSPYPYIIYGPPGTGKTMTVAEVILQICAREPDCRILVTAPTNSAVDTLGLRLLHFGTISKAEMVRITSYNAYTQGTIAVELVDISRVPHLGDPAHDSPLANREDTTPTMYLDDLGKHKITIGTLSTISYLNSAGVSKGYFTHIIIDEAGQCHEPDTLLPIALVQPHKTQLVLSGDPMQLGPVMASRLVKLYSFDRSFLDRLSSSYIYRKKVDDFKNTNGYNPTLITRLISNYRSLHKIVDLIGNVFYEGDLQSTVADNGSREAHLLEKIIIHGHELKQTMDSVVFINVNTPEEQIDNSMSWYNSGEVTQVWLVFSFLLRAGVSPDDIGVITPYALQVKKIYEFLDTIGAISPKVASVEEFQGQERDVVILSLVRNNLGSSKRISPFVCDPQRVNVALSRARVLNVIIGNKNTLMCHPLWVKILEKCLVINPSTNMDNCVSSSDRI